MKLLEVYPKVYNNEYFARDVQEPQYFTYWKDWINLKQHTSRVYNNVHVFVQNTVVEFQQYTGVTWLVSIFINILVLMWQQLSVMETSQL